MHQGLIGTLGSSYIVKCSIFSSLCGLYIIADAWCTFLHTAIQCLHVTTRSYSAWFTASELLVCILYIGTFIILLVRYVIYISVPLMHHTCILTTDIAIAAVLPMHYIWFAGGQVKPPHFLPTTL